VKVVSIKVDDETKERMESFADVNWSHVIRGAIRTRLETEESLRRGIDRRRALRAAEGIDAIRAKMSGGWSGAEEVRRWRDLRR